MEEEENLPIVSGDVENIIIKLEPTEDFLDDEDSPMHEGIHLQVDEQVVESEDKVFYGEFYSNEVSLPSEENESNIIQTPFYLESYFSDNDSRNFNDLIDMNYLTCVDCKIVFPTERLLQEHLVTHIDIHRMGCNVCDKDLNTAEKFQLHVMAITRQSIYYCDLCRKSCAGVVRSKDQTRPVGKIYACHDCEIEATGKPCFLNDLLPIPQDYCKIDNCILHSDSSTGIDVLKIHKENHNGATCNACEHCPKIFLPDTILQSNKIKNENFKIEYKLNGSKFNPDKCFHRCEHCDAFFAESFTLARHLRERHNLDKIKINSLRNSKSISNDETETQKFKCKHCEVMFSVKCKLTKHLKEKHKLERYKSKNVIPSVETEISVKNKFQCNQCDVSYSENFNLTKHLRQKHKKDKQKFICKLCLKEFSLQRCYDSHVSFHEIAKNYVCFACELAFLSKYELQQHLKIHNQEKKETEYKCEKKTLTDVNQKRNTRETRIRNS